MFLCVPKRSNPEVILGLLGTWLCDKEPKWRQQKQQRSEAVLKRKEGDEEVKGRRKCPTRGRRAADEFKPI